VIRVFVFPLKNISTLTQVVLKFLKKKKMLQNYRT